MTPMTRLLLLSLVAAWIASGARAQERTLPSAVPAALAAGDCAYGTAEQFLDVGDVRAALYTTGTLFRRESTATYTVPYTPGVESAGALFSLNLWVGGEVEGAARFAGATYGNWEFWPGPLDSDGETTPERCAAFDRIWRVSFDDLRSVTADGVGPLTNPDLIGWPVAHGAPYFVDVNGNDRRDASEPRLTLGPGDLDYSLTPGEGATLNLAAGERPDLVGDQAAWWVMNDNAGPHVRSQGDPLQIEVQVLAVAFDASDLAISQSTVYEFTVINRSPVPIDDARVSFFLVPQIGAYGDDFLASDADREMLISYNRTEIDKHYGTSPPALGLDLLSGAYGTVWVDDEMFDFPNAPDLDRPSAMRNAQASLWSDGTPQTRGGFGYNPDSTDVTRWRFDGDVIRRRYWTQEQPRSPSGTRSEMSSLLNTPAQTLAPGESRRVDLALLFAEGGLRDGPGSPDRTRFHNIARLFDISDAVQAAYDAGGTKAIRSASVAYTPPPPLTASPMLLAPDDGADYDEAAPDSLMFSWTAVEGAEGYHLRLGAMPDSTRPIYTRGTSHTVPAQGLPFNTRTSFWTVQATNWGGDGPAPPARSFSYFRYVYIPEALTVPGLGLAFVEVVGPGGADPCGTEAQSTVGCAQIGANGIYQSYNGTGDYIGTAIGTGPEASLPAFAPRDYEIRFTEAGSVAYYGLTSGVAVPVPFEVWDIGVTPPGADNDPDDDIQMVPVLFADGPDECVFEYGGPSQNGTGPTTQRIYAYYAVEDYAAWEEAIAPVVAADPNQCPTDPATAAASSEIDFDRGRPLQRFVLEQNAGGVDIDGLAGTVIRFYTTDPSPAPEEASPEPTPVPEPIDEPTLAVQPNPVVGAATVPFALPISATVRLRLVDVLGREVAVLAEAPYEAGPYEARLDASSLAAGIYVLVLDADDQRLTQTLTVLR